MNIDSFEIKYYRSITHSEVINLSAYNVLIGPNNEGKSNLLNGLSLGLKYLSNRSSLKHEFSFRRNTAIIDNSYDWATDYPLKLQNKNKDGYTQIAINFVFNKDEIKQFKKEVKAEIDGYLPILLKFQKNGPVIFEVKKQGRGKKVLITKQLQIQEFISKRLQFIGISATRTQESTMRNIQEIIRRSLSILDTDEEYKSLIKKLQEKQEGIIKPLSEKSKVYLKKYHPAIKNIEISCQGFGYFRAIPDIDIYIDDGVCTSLFAKGDGIQNLACIAFVQQAADLQKQDKQLILAIEEPEAHLHPGAIHELYDELNNISKSQQIIISTHSPILINRSAIENNIIVKNKKAKSAKNISEIRKCLGIEVPDNLISANKILLVEGKIDEEIIKEILCQKSDKLKSAIKSGLLSICKINGTPNLSYFISLYKNLLLNNVFILLDGDQSAKGEINKAKDEKLIKINEYFILADKHNKEIEVEDLFLIDKYIDEFNKELGVNITIEEYNKINSKFSDKIGHLLTLEGKSWDDKLKGEVKAIIKKIVLKDIGKYLDDSKLKPINNLILELERQ